MFRRLSTIAAIAVACFCSSQAAHAQFGGLSVQVGGYGSGVRVGGYSYGNGFYNSYGNAYGNDYGNGYGNPFYGIPYDNSFNGGYYNNGRPYTGLYPNFGYSYVAPPYYSAPVRSYPIRRFRYR